MKKMKNTMTDTCRTCSRLHGPNWNPRHPFNDGSLSGMAALTTPEKKKEPEPKQTGFPFDPVLRQAIIDKGLLTPDDLRAAEAKIRAVTATFEQEVKQT